VIAPSRGGSTWRSWAEGAGVTAIRTRPERLAFAVLLTAVGGYLDAYTFVGHGGVFANAQTGNFVMLAVFASDGRWHDALIRVPAIAAFVVGIFVAEEMGRPNWHARLRRPTRVVLIIEIVILAVLAALPAGRPDLVYNAAISFVAALQFATFRILADTPYTTILATGNMRSLIASAIQWRAEGNQLAGRRALRLGITVAAFVLGAAGGAAYTRQSGSVAVWVAAAALVVVMIALIVETRQVEHAAPPTETS
jgi:uncharacterized membrane protein YoaK (UPF0700 family)